MLRRCNNCLHKYASIVSYGGRITENKNTKTVFQERICDKIASSELNQYWLIHTLKYQAEKPPQKCINCHSLCYHSGRFLGTVRRKCYSSYTSTTSNIGILRKLKTDWLGSNVKHVCTLHTSCTALKKSKSHDDSSQYDEDLEDILLDEANKGSIQDEYLLPGSGHRVFVVQPDFKHISGRKRELITPKHQLAEACSLVESLPRWTVADKAIINIKSGHTKELFGKGTFEKLRQTLRSSQSYSAVFISIEMLSGSQLSTLQDVFDLPVYDRFTIVLQIFKTRAKTKEARLQVALAEIPYYRSRIHGINLGTLDRQKGGAQHIGGAGETYMEIRQRLLQERELKIKKALEKVRKNRDMLRKDRAKRDFPVVAVVGYTNAGKTSLIKALTDDKSMHPRDQLFATLDVTAHAGLLPNHMKVLYVDTVGFISDIPTSLISSFSATLEDALSADVIVHVRDISHPDTEAQRHNVIETLGNLHLPNELQSNIIEVCNKVDCIEEESLHNIPEETFAISATQGYGLQALVQEIQKKVVTSTGRLKKCLKIPMSGPHLSWLYKEATVEDTKTCDEDPEFLLVYAVMTEAVYGKFVSQFGDKKKTGMKS